MFIFSSFYKMMSFSMLGPDFGSLITLQSVRGQSLGKTSEQMTKLSVILKSDKYHSEVTSWKRLKKSIALAVT